MISIIEDVELRISPSLLLLLLLAQYHALTLKPFGISILINALY